MAIWVLSLLFTSLALAHSGLKTIVVDGTVYVYPILLCRAFLIDLMLAIHHSTLESTIFWGRSDELSGLMMSLSLLSIPLPIFRIQDLLVNSSVSHCSAY